MKAVPRPWIDGLEAYVPGRPAHGAAGSLASNEAPTGASPTVGPRLREEFDQLHRYPDPLANALRAALGDHLSVDPDQILVGAGSDELIHLLALTYAAGGGRVVTPDPAFSSHVLAPTALGADVVSVPMVGGVHDLAAMAEVEADLAFVTNPHNPTGTAVDGAAIRQFVDRSRAAIPVIDEAYVEYCDDPASTTAVPLAAEGRAVVLRTFSKAYGLAGLRIGYLVGPRDVVADLRRVRKPFSVGLLSQTAALAALADQEHLARSVDENRRHREVLTRLFEGVGSEVLPSQANFLLVRDERADALMAVLERHGVMVRPGVALGTGPGFRITVPGSDGLVLVEAAVAEFSSVGDDDE